MTSKAKLLGLLILVSAAFVPASLFAQGTCNPPCQSPSPNPSTGFSTQFEISPYGGYIWPGSSGSVPNFFNTQLIGARVGFYITPNFEIGGNYSWNNHFQPESDAPESSFAGALGFPQGKSRAHIWEAEFSYNFGKRTFGGANLTPYVVGGAGGLTTQISNPSQFTLNVRPVVTTTPFGTPVSVFVPNDVDDDLRNILHVQLWWRSESRAAGGPPGVLWRYSGPDDPELLHQQLNLSGIDRGPHHFLRRTLTVPIRVRKDQQRCRRGSPAATNPYDTPATGSLRELAGADRARYCDREHHRWYRPILKRAGFYESFILPVEDGHVACPVSLRNPVARCTVRFFGGTQSFLRGTAIASSCHVQLM